MTKYLDDAAHLALCDAICDSEVLCEAFGVPADPISGMPTPDRAAFELGAKLDLWPERHRPLLELEALLEGIREIIRTTIGRAA